MEILRKEGKYVEIPADGGHFDGVAAVARQGEAIRKFLAP